MEKINPIPQEIKKLLSIGAHSGQEQSNITTGWARNSNWDERMSARDMFQNFYDGAINSGKAINEIKALSPSKNTTMISLEGVSFDVRRLFYLGSEKDSSTNIGQVGEGFKLACVSLLREHNIRIFVASQSTCVEISVSTNSISGEINLAPMLYNYYDLDADYGGNCLIIHGAGQKLTEALIDSRYEFYYPEHPAIGEAMRISGYKSEIDIHKRTDAEFGTYTNTKQGYIFYHNQLRAVIPDANVVVIINKRWKSIDDKIGQDRDRTFFGDKLKANLLRLALKSVYYFRDDDAYEELMEVSKDSLPRGNVFLSALSDGAARYRDYDIDKEFSINELRRKKYLGDVFAKTYVNQDNVAIINQKLKDGFKEVPAYMSKFGALEIWMEMEIEKEKQTEETLNSGARQPTVPERRVIEMCLSRLINAEPILNKMTFHIFQSATLLGEFKSKNEVGYFGSSDVYLAASLFDRSVGEICSVIIHEISHALGNDGSRKFTDALTEIIADFINQSASIEKIISEIQLALEDVKQERQNGPTLADTVSDLIKRKNPEEMSKILSKIPLSVLTKHI